MPLKGWKLRECFRLLLAVNRIGGERAARGRLAGDAHRMARVRASAGQFLRAQSGAGFAEVENQPPKQNAPDSFESRDVCRSALPQVLLNPKTNRKPPFGKWPARAITSTKVTGAFLLHGDQIKFPRRFLIEKCALFRIAAAPMFVPAGNPQEIARTHPLLARVILIQISSLQDHDRYIVRMSVHSVVLAGRELGECAMRSSLHVPPDRGYRNTRVHRDEVRMIGGSEDYLFALRFLSLHRPTDHAAMSATAAPTTNIDLFILILLFFALNSRSKSKAVAFYAVDARADRY